MKILIYEEQQYVYVDEFDTKFMVVAVSEDVAKLEAMKADLLEKSKVYDADRENQKPVAPWPFYSYTNGNFSIKDVPVI